MSYQYKKLYLETPKSYQELTRNRPTKRRNYNYSRNAEVGPEIANIPLTNIIQTPINDLYESGSIQARIKNQIMLGQADKPDIAPKQSERTILELNNYQVGQKIISDRQISSGLQKQKSNIHLSIRKELRIQDDSMDEQDFSCKVTHFDSSKKQNNRNVASISPTNHKYLSKYSQLYPKQQISNKLQPQKDNQMQVEESIFKEEKQNKSSKKSFQIYSSSNNYEDKLKKQVIQPLIQRKLKQFQYHYGQKQIDRDKIRQEVELKYEQAIKKQKIYKKQCQLDIQIEQIKKKILNNSPFMLPPGITVAPYNECSFKSEICKISDSLSKLVELDIELLKFRQEFESWLVQDKWQSLKSEFSDNHIQFQMDELKEEISVSPYEKNPFGIRKVHQKFNKIKELVTSYKECQKVWDEQIEKCGSLQRIAKEGNCGPLQDLQFKQNLNLQDVVCFINFNSQKLYRSRDVFSLFRRFLKLQGKKIQKIISLSTIKYQTFINKLVK